MMAAGFVARTALLVLGYAAGAGCLWGLTSSASMTGRRTGAVPRALLSERRDESVEVLAVQDLLPSDGQDWIKFLTPVMGQFLFGILYYCFVASRYPRLYAPSQASARLQQENEVMATSQTSCANCCLAWCCAPARAAHTFDATSTCSYWPSLCLMSLCPCLTLFYVNSCTDINPKLGGQPKGCFMGLLCTFLCSCCVIAQDAESLDAATGASTGCCGVQQPSMAVPMCIGQPGPGNMMQDSQLGTMPPMMGGQPMPIQEEPELLDCMHLLCTKSKQPAYAPGNTMPPMYSPQQGF